MTTAEMRKRMAWLNKLMDRTSGDTRQNAIDEWNKINQELIPIFRENSEVIFSVNGRNEFSKKAKIEVFKYSDGLYAYADCATTPLSGYFSWFHGECRKTREEAIESATERMTRWCRREVRQGNKDAGPILKELSKVGQQSLF